MNKINDEAIRLVFMGRRWQPEKCIPLKLLKEAFFWTLGGLATVPFWLYLIGGFTK